MELQSRTPFFICIKDHYKGLLAVQMWPRLNIYGINWEERFDLAKVFWKFLRVWMMLKRRMEALTTWKIHAVNFKHVSKIWSWELKLSGILSCLFYLCLFRSYSFCIASLDMNHRIGKVLINTIYLQKLSISNIILPASHI